MIRYLVIYMWYLVILVHIKNLITNEGDGSSLYFIISGFIIVTINTYTEEIKNLIHKNK